MISFAGRESQERREERS